MPRGKKIDVEKIRADNKLGDEASERFLDAFGIRADEETRDEEGRGLRVMTQGRYVLLRHDLLDEVIAKLSPKTLPESVIAGIVKIISYANDGGGLPEALDGAKEAFPDVDWDKLVERADREGRIAKKES